MLFFEGNNVGLKYIRKEEVENLVILNQSIKQSKKQLLVLSCPANKLYKTNGQVRQIKKKHPFTHVELQMLIREESS